MIYTSSSVTRHALIHYTILYPKMLQRVISHCHNTSNLSGKDDNYTMFFLILKERNQKLQDQETLEGHWKNSKNSLIASSLEYLYTRESLHAPSGCLHINWKLSKKISIYIYLFSHFELFPLFLILK